MVRRRGIGGDIDRTRVGTVRFASMTSFVAAEIESTPLIDRIDAGIYTGLLEECREVLARFV
jgi:hypothetical protein